MANVLSIAALVVSWRATLTTTGPLAYDTAKSYDDPHWYFFKETEFIQSCTDKIYQVHRTQHRIPSLRPCR